MNWDRIEGNWKQLKGSFKQQWGMLTDGQPDVIAGERERLAGRIQVSYGINKDKADKQLHVWRTQHTLTGPTNASIDARVTSVRIKPHLAPH
jgi:uncharacterized protein YjbJ (UPF0337 family)